ncbi:pentatricopeptide repeat-containing protein At4g19440, chloroplastic-like [Olea europaea var. sylvestris]|uniref:pentatricopeptide repeat-containing protein At4g19440, chloroplastic-like n=1 Tax=Olea europaea var. sylvestris TaxID=158386 RepID=UPI000C1CE08C|nr:pentatricopeptide repeat-containing protein At4g19440, chloroplastic-like [Olea europaea var. sylvestris]
MAKKVLDSSLLQLVYTYTFTYIFIHMDIKRFKNLNPVPITNAPENQKSSKIKVEEEGAPVKLGRVPTQTTFDQTLLNKKWLTLHHFDTILLEIYHLIDPTIALKFFYFASASALQIHSQILLPFDSLDPITFDILVHVYASQFKSLGFDVAVDVFRLLTSRVLFPSFKTSHFLLCSLVKADELEKCYKYVDKCVMKRRVNDVVMLFKKMEDVCIAPNFVTDNNLLHGLLKKGKLEEAFQLKEEMVNNGLNPSHVTYGVLINGLTKIKKYDEANFILKKCWSRGLEMLQQR